MTGAVELRRVQKRFGAVTAVRALDLTIDEGSFVTLLGPSGCGKSTTLRMIAGLEQPSAGDILIKGARINDVPIHQRNLGLVFQSFALFPHMTVQENVAYGLKFRGLARPDRERRVARALEIVRLPELGERLPSQLSGGQQQRVALARAIAIQPHVLLLDEPLSSLDATLREEMRLELKTIQRELGVTTIFVTHDQSEALALSDKIVVMRQGDKEQEGPPDAVYARPATRFVAEFLGHSNFFDGVLDPVGPALALPDGTRLALPPGKTGAAGPAGAVVRAERIRIDGGDRPAEAGAATALAGRVVALDYQGTTARYLVEAAGRRLQVITMTDGALLREGTPVTLRIRAADCILLPAAQAG